MEGIDEAIVDTMRMRRGNDSVAALPQGRAFLYVGLDGPDAEAVARDAETLLARLWQNGRLRDGRVVLDAQDRTSLWRVREDGAGLSSRPASGGESQAGWEDSAVAPENLAGYLTDFRQLLVQHELTGIMYGHLGAGCMHIRITYDLRSEISGILNPGSITDADPFDTNLAHEGIPVREWRTHFELHPEAASEAGTTAWNHAVQSCIGVGRCRSDHGGVMCPSFRAAQDEKDSTRGRSRVLQDMVRGARSVEEGWKSEEVREALDLCLSCQA